MSSGSPGVLKGRAALVTGAASGIGRAIAQRLDRDGAQVLGVDRRPEGPVEMFEADLCDADANAAAVREAVERFGRLDIVVAGAGIQHVSPIAEFPIDRWRTIIDLMLTSPFLLARASWPQLAASGSGRFIVIASAHALAASPFKAAYVSAKHGVLGLVKTLALEGASAGISATAVCPAVVRTPLAERQVAERGLDAVIERHAVKRMLEPSEVADVVAFLLGPAGRGITGVPVPVDLGWTAA